MVKSIKTVLFICLAIGGAGLINVNAQESIQAGGGDATGPDGDASYSLGQVAYLSATGTDGSSSPGVIQPFEIFVLRTKSAANVELACSTYPNPATTVLMLRVEDSKLNGLTWKLTDLAGKKLQSQRLTEQTTSISLAEVPIGTYLLTVQRGTAEFKTFKIIKH